MSQPKFFGWFIFFFLLGLTTNKISCELGDGFPNFADHEAEEMGQVVNFNEHAALFQGSSVPLPQVSEASGHISRLHSENVDPNELFNIPLSGDPNQTIASSSVNKNEQATSNKPDEASTSSTVSAPASSSTSIPKTQSAPVPSTTPVAPTTAAPVAPTTSAPVAPTTSAPIVPTTAVPATSRAENTQTIVPVNATTREKPITTMPETTTTLVPSTTEVITTAKSYDKSARSEDENKINADANEKMSNDQPTNVTTATTNTNQPVSNTTTGPNTNTAFTYGLTQSLLFLVVLQALYMNLSNRI